MSWRKNRLQLWLNTRPVIKYALVQRLPGDRKCPPSYGYQLLMITRDSMVNFHCCLTWWQVPISRKSLNRFSNHSELLVHIYFFYICVEIFSKFGWALLFYKAGNTVHVYFNWNLRIVEYKIFFLDKNKFE